MAQRPPVGQTTITITTGNNPGNEYVPPKEGWCAMNQRNKPQSNSVGTAALIFITGGMCAAWSIGYRIVPSEYNHFHMDASWYIGAIIGAFISGILTNRVPKRILYVASTLFVLVGGIIFSATSTEEAFLAARYLIGIGNGLIFVTCMNCAGEESIKELRGLLTSSIESVCFNVGMAIQVIHVTSWPTPTSSNSFDTNQLLGVLCISFSFLALIVMIFLLVESPVYHILHNNNDAALDSIKRLVTPKEMTPDRHAVFEEVNDYVSSNLQLSMGESISAGIPVLFKLIVYRCLMAMTYTKIVTSYFITSYIIALSSLTVIWPPIVYYSLRWLGSFILSMTMDFLGRKIPLLFSILVGGALSFAIGHMFKTLSIWTIFSQMDRAMYLFFFFSFFCGAFTSASSPYISEAFPLRVKPVFIATLYIIEMLFTMLLFLSNANYEFFFGIGGVAIAFFFLGIFCLPETMKLALIDAQYKFEVLFNNPFHP